jgi:L-fucose isomerase-like protein
LEILSFIIQRKGIAKIMQHPKDIVFPDDTETASLTRPPLAKVLNNEKKQRLGVIGKSSDWLIASTVDYKEVTKKINMELVDIPIEEVTSLGEVDPGMKGAEAIYERLKEIIAKHKLDGITIRCFDIFPVMKNTACVAISKLIDEGIPAGCEGDIPVLLTMMVCKNLTGEIGWMGSPARIQPDGKILMAKCTISLKMTKSHEFTTHFESGIGVAIHGEVEPGDYTLVKLSPDLKRILAVNVTVTGCQHEENMCRTQIWIQSTPIVSQYLLTSPLADHHVLLKGHQAAKFWRE